MSKGNQQKIIEAIRAMNPGDLSVLRKQCYVLTKAVDEFNDLLRSDSSDDVVEAGLRAALKDLFADSPDIALLLESSATSMDELEELKDDLTTQLDSLEKSLVDQDINNYKAVILSLDFDKVREICTQFETEGRQLSSILSSLIDHEAVRELISKDDYFRDQLYVIAHSRLRQLRAEEVVGKFGRDKISQLISVRDNPEGYFNRHRRNYKIQRELPMILADSYDGREGYHIALKDAAYNRIAAFKKEDMTALSNFIFSIDLNTTSRNLDLLKQLATTTDDQVMVDILRGFVKESFESGLLETRDVESLRSQAQVVLATHVKNAISSDLKTISLDKLQEIATAANLEEVKSALLTKYPNAKFLRDDDGLNIHDEAVKNIKTRVIDPIVKLINDVKYSAELEELCFDDQDVDDPDVDDPDVDDQYNEKLDKALVKWLKDKNFSPAIEEGFFKPEQLALLRQQALKQREVLHAPYDKAPANIMLSSMGLWKDFTYEVQRGKSAFSRAAALAASTSAQTSVRQENPADAEYLGYHLKGDDAVVFTAKFEVTSAQGAKAEVSAKLVLDSAAKVTNMTSELDYKSLSKYDKIKLALKQVEMLLLNYDSKNGPVIITGKNPEQAQFILAALYHVKASHEDFKKLKMECYVPGVQVQESSFIKFRTKDKAEAKYVEDTFGAHRGLLDGLLSHIERYKTKVEITSKSATNRTFQRIPEVGSDDRKDILDDEVYSPNEDEEEDDAASFDSEDSGDDDAASFGSENSGDEDLDDDDASTRRTLRGFH